MPHPGLPHPEPLSLQQATAEPFLHRSCFQFCLNLCGVSGSWCTQGLFEPSEHLWLVWGLILNVISPLQPFCWGFSALGCGVSPLGCSSTAQLLLQCIALNFTLVQMILSCTLTLHIYIHVHVYVCFFYLHTGRCDCHGPRAT